MTISDLHCDVCEAFVAGPTGGPAAAGGGGVRFVYHPGRPQLRDTSGLMCTPCWEQVVDRMTAGRHPLQCSVCGQTVTREGSLHLQRFEEGPTWRLCASHTVEFLNGLRTVQPKLEPAGFRFPFEADSPA